MSLFATVYVGRVTDAHFDGVVRNVGGVRRAITVVGQRLLFADKPSIYKFTTGSGKTRRKIPRDPSLN
jgi:hypothetical protein